MAVKGPDLKKTILSCVSVADVPYDVFRSRTYEQKCPIDANISFEEERKGCWPWLIFEFYSFLVVLPPGESSVRAASCSSTIYSRQTAGFVEKA